MTTLIIYGVEGCGPCEVAKRFFDQQKITYEFIDLNQDQAARRDVASRLETPTSGVVLEVYGDEQESELEVLQGVSLIRLRQWLEHHPQLKSEGSTS
ncbi:MAG: glutaredoxin family protein [Deinococcota bacterium]